MTFTPLASQVWGLGPIANPDLIFNGVDDAGVRWVMPTPEGWNTTTADTPVMEAGGDGGWFAPGRLKPRVLTLTGAFSAPPGAEQWAETRLRAALAHFREDQILWCGPQMLVPALQVTVRLTGELHIDPQPGNPRVRTFSAVLTAADPLKYAAGPGGPGTFGIAQASPWDVPGYTQPGVRRLSGVLGGHRLAATSSGSSPAAAVSGTDAVLYPAQAQAATTQTTTVINPDGSTTTTTTTTIATTVVPPTQGPGGSYGTTPPPRLVLPNPGGSGGIVSQTFALLDPARAGGLIFPVRFPLTLSGFPNPSDQPTYNPGDLLAYPVVEFDGDVLNPKITSATDGGLFWGLTGHLAAGQVAVADLGLRTLLVNGVSSRSMRAAGSDYFRILPGRNDLVFTADAYSPTATCRITYRPTWR